MVNVVAAIYGVESEAFQAIAELRQVPVGEKYAVAEAILLKNEDGRVVVLDAFDTGATTSNDTAAGMIVGSFVGILGGPVGVLLGASYGALLGGVVDSADAMDTASAIEVLADKLFENEVALVALVEEEEPAFDAALAKFSPTIIRYDVDDVIAEVDRARELEAELSRQAKAQLRAERKVERKEHREEVKSNIKDRFANIKAKFNKDDECGCGCEA